MNPGARMSPSEIERLLEVLGWNQKQLAAALDISNAVVSRWLSGERKPGGPACILMRQFLDAAQGGRKKIKQTA